ncbi:siderophore-interacting protein [Dickeya fangzhongdai]|uniref:NADPH-dependent ferric siderophore reductase n=1 Tax=Dickeya fangzhongdai TaxID=1778540 RepID=A0A2K8QQY5_9GAMM|nr:siderophore-interacting protein [Dickeya fangzhongdai]ATZ95866.1 NADPH-dependent ferric siderophore reductase [Dickeya fangzhongdai]QOH49309.1 siderophore-interacting protein [Dickeya fangzhongdai]QOH53613.1 siderophore-interacting protein [Dickeya fangzhongdai]WOX99185.1 siderophore-interacting protein [Dickeya fangzhongdai]WOY05662.1 siderophore-interacting protein [Dickeya fangzhongdai]
MAGVKEYKVFDVTLAHKTLLTPSLMRCVFSGEAVKKMKICSPDQRIKVLLPAEDGTPPRLPDVGEWYKLVQAMPKAQRPIPRTYTLRSLDTVAGEMVVEFVVHGTEGPASAWAMSAQPGEELQVVAPRGDFAGDNGGYEWVLSENTRQVLLMGDETALPAIKGILEQLSQLDNPPQVQAFIEVPLQADCIDYRHLTFAEVVWLPREGTDESYGERLLDAARQSVRLPENIHAGAVTVAEIPDGEIMWERANAQQGQFFGWVAAESSAVKALRRYLLGEKGMTQESITFMAYWSRGPRPH